MNKYYQELNDIFEDRAVNLINNAQDRYIVRRNNLDNAYTDLIIDERFFIDVQYSFNFSKFGDIRIDVLSAFYFKKDINKENSLKIIKNSNENSFFKEVENIFDVKTYGKYLKKDVKCDGVFYFLFNGNKPVVNNKPDIETIKKIKISKIVYIPNSIIENELKYNWLENKINFKINDKEKNGIKEMHSSAFVCFNLNKLIEKYEIPVFKNREELNSGFINYFIKTAPIRPKNNYKKNL